MESQKLTNMLKIISEKLSEKNVPFCLIGAMALGLYGLPRYTSDIDLLTEEERWGDILPLMKSIGYNCFQKTDSFAQFDSELGVFGKVDFMFVRTKAGKDIIKNSIISTDPYFSGIHVIQPTDYVILKMMAIANNPERTVQDESDISNFFKLYHGNMIATDFLPIDVEKIIEYSNKFGQNERIKKYLNIQGNNDEEKFQL